MLIAAERTGRRARARWRLILTTSMSRCGGWESYTGKAAVLAATGSTFEEITEERTSNSAAAFAASGGCNDEHAR